MKIELKNVKFSEHMSEETNAFTADVFIEGKKCGYAKNDGRGGSTYVGSYFTPDSKAIIDRAENYLNTQPEINIGTEAKPFMVESCLENVVDQLFDQWLTNKELKKLEKKMETSLMWGIPNNDRYTIVNFKVKLLQIPHNILQDKITFYKGLFKEGEKFLNTNLVGFEL